jgi:hypothetical protein
MWFAPFMSSVERGDAWHGVPVENLSGLLTSVGFCLTLFGIAGTVEFLFRIWREVVLLRQARER